MNKFDEEIMNAELNGLNSLEGLDGFFSKAFKSVKKKLSSVNRARKKVYKKIVPKKIRSVVGKVVNNPIIQKVAIGVVGLVGTPAAANALRGVLAISSAKKARGASARAADAEVTQQLKSMGYSDAEVKEYLANPDAFIKKIEAHNASVAQNIQATAPAAASAVQQTYNSANAVARSSAFNNASRQMNPTQVQPQWQQSQAFRVTAFDGASNAAFSMIYDDLIKQGVDPTTAREQAAIEAQKVATKAVDSAGGMDMSKLLVPGALLALTLLK